MSKVAKGKATAPSAPDPKDKKGAKGADKNAPVVEEKKEWKPCGRKKLKALYGGTVRSAGAKLVGEWEVQEWQRLPRQLLQEYLQKQKRPKAEYHRVRVRRDNPLYRDPEDEDEDDEDEDDEDEDQEAEQEEPRKFRFKVVLPDVKKAEKDLVLETHQCYSSDKEAMEMAAMLALHTVTPTVPYEAKLPSPFKERWLTLQGKAERPAVSMASEFASAQERRRRDEAARIKAVQRERERALRLEAKLNRLCTLSLSEPLREGVQEVLRRTHAMLTPQGFVPTSDPDSLKGPAAAVYTWVLTRLNALGFAHRDCVAGALAAVNHVRAHGCTRSLHSVHRGERKDPAQLMQVLASAAQASKARGKGAGADASREGEGDGARKGGRDQEEDQGEVVHDSALHTDSLPALAQIAIEHLVLTVPEHRLPPVFDPRGQQLALTNYALLREQEEWLGDAAAVLQLLGSDRMGIPLPAIKRAYEVAATRAADDRVRVHAALGVLFADLYAAVQRAEDAQAECREVEVRGDGEGEVVEATTRVGSAGGQVVQGQWRYQHVSGGCVWSEEVAVLREVLGARVEQRGDTHVRVHLHKHDAQHSAAKDICLYVDIVLPPHCSFPAHPPALVVRDEHGVLAPHRCLQLTVAALQHVHRAIADSGQNDAGGILWSLLEFLRTRWEDVIVGPSTFPLPDQWLDEPDLNDMPAPRGASLSAAEAVRALRGVFGAQGLAPAALERLRNHVATVYRANPRTHAAASGGGGGGASSSFTSSPFARYLPRDPAAVSAAMLREWQRKSAQDAEYQAMLARRAQLPSMQFEQDILQTIARHRVVVLRGETGCGKSTQVPQMLLDEYIKAGRGAEILIMCTQPRRISAIGVAERVAAERAEKCGDVVGYSVRLDNRTSSQTRLIFATVGVLLRQLVSAADAEVPLAGLTHLLIDEVHERSVDIDFLLLVVRQVLQRRPDLRVVLMSATVKAEMFTRYFSAAEVAEVGVRDKEKEKVKDKDDKKDKKEKKEKKEKKDKDDKKDKAEEKGKSKGDKGKGKEEKGGFGSFGGDLQLGGGFDSFVDVSADNAGSRGERKEKKDDKEKREGKEGREKKVDGKDGKSRSRALHPLPAEVPVVSVPGRTFPVTEHYVAEVLHGTGYTPAHQYRTMMQPDARSTLAARLQKVDAELRARGGDEERIPLSVYEVAATLSSSAPVDLALCEAAIWHVCRRYPLQQPGGAILVFLPGAGEITALRERLQRALAQGECGATGLPCPVSCEVEVLMLHGALPTHEQRRVFEKLPPGVRKVVLATNIAETSLTVEDCEYVIDTGRVKETQVDPVRRMSKLVDTCCSRASCEQRKGRAGRVRAGHCFRLFSQAQWDKLPAHGSPEIHRVLLDNVCLMAKALRLEQLTGTGSGAGALLRVLRQCMEPPAEESVAGAVADLVSLQAFTPDEALTPLGEILARLPVGNTRIGKLLILGAVFRCATPLAVIAALLSERSPFVAPLEKRAEAAAKRKQFEVELSDHLTLWRLFAKYSEVKRQGKARLREWCRDNFVSQATLETCEGLVKQYLEALAEVGLLPRTRKGKGRGERPSKSEKGHKGSVAAAAAEEEGAVDVDVDALVLGAAQVSGDLSAAMRSGAEDPDQYAHVWPVVNAALTAGLYPNVAKVKAPAHTYVKTAHGMVALPPHSSQLSYYTRMPDFAQREEQVLLQVEAAGMGAGVTEDLPAEADAPEEEEEAAARGSTAYVPPVAGRVFPHPRSVNFSTRAYECPWVVFLQVNQTSKAYLQDSSMASAYALALLGGEGRLTHGGHALCVDGWVHFRPLGAKVGVLVALLRGHMQALLQHIVAHPRDHALLSSPLVQALLLILSTNGY